MIDKLQILFEKYKFDYLYINPKNISDIEFEFIPDEMFSDFKCKPDYLGTVKINNILIEVYYDKKITPGDVIFKYKDIKKERIVKLEKLLKN
jgi:hypothetical protein